MSKTHTAIQCTKLSDFVLNSFTRLEVRLWIRCGTPGGCPPGHNISRFTMNFHIFIHPCSEDQPPNCDVPRPHRSRPHGQLLRGGPQGVRDYAAVTYEALYSYLIEGLRYWYKLYSPSQEGWWADVDEADAPAEDAREGAVVRADTVPPPATFNMVFRSAGVRPRMRARSRMRVRSERLLPNNDWIQFNSLPS